MKLIQKQISIAIYITALFFGAVTLNSCTDFEDVNTNTIDCWSDLSGISLESTSELINTVYAFPASDKNEQMKAIAFQLWIALYNQGFEAWTQWRRLDYPTLTVAVRCYNAAVNNGVPTIPKRFTYPATEPGTNTDNYANASKNIGGDYLYTPLFRDPYNNQGRTHNQTPALSGK